MLQWEHLEVQVQDLPDLRSDGNTLGPYGSIWDRNQNNIIVARHWHGEAGTAVLWDNCKPKDGTACAACFSGFVRLWFSLDERYSQAVKWRRNLRVQAGTKDNKSVHVESPVPENSEPVIENMERSLPYS